MKKFIIFALGLIALGGCTESGDLPETFENQDPKEDLILMHTPGMGIAQTNPYQALGDRPRTGEYPLQCDGEYPENGSDARKTKTWLWLDNASYQPNGPLPPGAQAASFGHLSRRLEDAGYKNIQMSHNEAMLKQMMEKNPRVIIAASKGIKDVIDVVNDKKYSGSILLINGASSLFSLNQHISSPLKAAVLTHGLEDNEFKNRLTKDQAIALLPTNTKYFVYENKFDGHNPRSLAFPSKSEMIWKNWPQSCFLKSPPSFAGNHSPGGNHRADESDSYLIDLVDALISGSWQKLIAKLDKDPNITKTWVEGSYRK